MDFSWALSHVLDVQKTVISEAEVAGFSLKHEPILLQENYFLIFEKTPEPVSKYHERRQDMTK